MHESSNIGRKHERKNEGMNEQKNGLINKLMNQLTNQPTKQPKTNNQKPTTNPTKQPRTNWLTTNQQSIPPNKLPSKQLTHRSEHLHISTQFLTSYSEKVLGCFARG